MKKIIIILLVFLSSCTVYKTTIIIYTERESKYPEWNINEYGYIYDTSYLYESYPIFIPAKSEIIYDTLFFDGGRFLYERNRDEDNLFISNNPNHNDSIINGK